MSLLYISYAEVFILIEQKALIHFLPSEILTVLPATFPEKKK